MINRGIQLEKLKTQKLTLGRLAAIVIMVISIGSGAIALAKWSDVSRHEDKSIGRAHPDVKEQFVSQQQFQQVLRGIDAKLARIEEVLKSIVK